MIKERRIFLAIFFLLLIISGGCHLLKKSTSIVEPTLDYRPTEANLQPELFLERVSTTKSILHIQIPRNFLFSKKDSEYSFSTLTIDTKSYVDPENPVAFDSLTFWIEPTQEDYSKSFIYKKINLYATDVLHWVQLTMTDTSKGIAQLYYLKLPNQNLCPKCIPYNAKTSQPIYRNSLKPNEKFSLKCNGPKPDSILVSYSHFESISSENIGTDSTWYQKPTDEQFGNWEKEGIYTISYGDLADEIKLILVSKSYPVLNTPNQLIEPLRYLASKTEIAELDTASKRKVAIDNFWLRRAGSANNARELLAKYYGRAFWANRIFTEQKPGWQTDRGKTLLLLGIPEEAYSNGRTERWTYRNEKGKTFHVEFSDSDTISQFSNFTFSKNIPQEIEKQALVGWNTGKPANFAQPNQN